MVGKIKEQDGTILILSDNFRYYIVIVVYRIEILSYICPLISNVTSGEIFGLEFIKRLRVALSIHLMTPHEM